MIIRNLLAIFLSLITSLALANQTDEQKYFDKVRVKIQDKCKNSKNYIQCRVDNSPSKCKSLAFNNDLGSWARCVRSCGSASFISKSVGECS